MPEVFQCPACSAPLEFQGKMMQKCSFCGSTVIVPSETIRHSSSFGGAGTIDFTDIAALTGKALRLAEVQQQIQAGKKIIAIKIFREIFGVGLKEAKDAVDAMERGESIDISGMQVQSAGPGITNALIRRSTQVDGGSLVRWLIFVGFLVFAGIAVIVFFVARSQDRGADPMWKGMDATSRTACARWAIRWLP